MKILKVIVYLSCVLASGVSFAQDVKVNNISELHISELGNGKLLWVRGEINRAWIKAVMRKLRKSEYTGIVLDSPGGLVSPAQKLARFIKKNKLNTYSFISCASACTVAFAAGEKRFLSHAAKLGFHQLRQQYYQGPDAIEYLERTQNAIKRQFKRAGVLKAFIDDMYRAKSHSLWVPSHKELLAANLVHEIIPQKNTSAPSPKSSHEELFADVNKAIDMRIGLLSRISVWDWAGGKVLWARGEINKDWSERVLEKLKNNTYQGIILDSPGGLIEPAQKVARYIRKQKLNTYSFLACVSTCAIAFIAGKERLMSHKSMLMFHQVKPDYYRGTNARRYFERSQQVIKRLFERDGVSKTFTENMFRGKPTPLWVPSHDELKEANVITRVVDPKLEIEKL